ncbi:precorrin-6A/cobalt-precorrin-6A reductase [Jatrophihabitans sp. GAS493]|uniref:cobalt-precorrin-6A reductase n=1 Tax=Jatrophihabitans sp. GAS493 TaxID=1907575 RepID=UPI000BC08E76|nr:cobalt-precorrin-6A reductase [Jatrophihabitans sp. GAS493]SOD74494.1 precorrin-6A/cobalt-precorrin-6A reductase [Jatrophihabitans sp. GAS493]
MPSRPEQPLRVLLLGGTAEARTLAKALDGSDDVTVISSLAGRVQRPALPVGELRVGGFGGADGLADYLTSERIDALVDATHPFAGSITGNAVAAADVAGVPLLMLRRPGWREQPGDDWHRVTDITAAAELARQLAPADSWIFLTTGRRDLAPFTGDSDHSYLIRSVDPPVVELPPKHSLLLDRGPYTHQGELALLRRHDIRVLVSKDSGGEMTYPKLLAARELRIPVVLIDRPALPDGDQPVTDDVVAAAEWCRQQSTRGKRESCAKYW